MGFPMDERLVSAARVLPDYLGQHVLLSASALALGVVLSLPLAVAAVGRPRLRWSLLAIASAIQTIPGLALLALFYPLLLALSALLKPALDLSVPALGFLPALLALTLYSMLPILRNGITGLSGVDPAVSRMRPHIPLAGRWNARSASGGVARPPPPEFYPILGLPPPPRLRWHRSCHVRSVIQAIAPECSDQTFRIWVLPGRSR